MEIKAFSLPNRLELKKIETIWGKVEQHNADYLFLPYKNDSFVVFIKYGVVVFWNCTREDISHVLGRLQDQLGVNVEIVTEETMEVNLNGHDGIKHGRLFLSDLNPDKIGLVSLVIGRSVLMDRMETELENLIVEYNTVIKNFARTGKAKYSSKTLTKMVAKAMQIEHNSVNQMAILDRPDLIWDEPRLDKFYNLLVNEYELDDRYKILYDKLKALYQSSEFILNIISTKQSFIVEVAILGLIMIELIIFFLEKII